MTADERTGIFPDTALTGSVQGAAWAQALTSRNPGGGTVTAGTPYNQLGTPVITGGVPGHDRGQVAADADKLLVMMNGIFERARRRYARGEITHEEYQRLRTELG